MPRFLGLAFLRSLLRDRRGNALMLTAFALPFVIAAAGLGVHTMELTLDQRELQREADSAAMAGAYSLYQGQGNTAAIAQANKALTQNPLVSNVTKTLTPGSYTSGGTTYTQSMYVKLVSTRNTPLMAMFGQSTVVVSAEARAATVPNGKVCFLALESGTTTGITFAGNSNLDLGCGTGTNSIAGIAVDVNGNPSVTASPIVAMGGIPPSSAYTSGTVFMANHARLNDPFAGNSYDPGSSTVSNGACKTGSSWRTIDVPSGTTANGGLYPPGCYGTINVQGTIQLQAGTYYLADGGPSSGLQIGAQAHFTCDFCTFVLTSTSNGANSFAIMNINGGAEVHIKPPLSGIYAGITIYRDSRAPESNHCCTINGNSSSSFKGAFYFPNDTLTFNGTSGMVLDCFQMVALRLQFSGNSAITNTCTLPGGDDKWALDSVRLIG